MVSKEQERVLCGESRRLLEKSGLYFSEREYESMVTADFGLSRPRIEGLQVLTFVDTKHMGAKAITLLPKQTMVEHWHPRRGDDPGKEETLRCLFGVCRVYVPGEPTLSAGFVPEGQEEFYSCRHELLLTPGDQYTFSPGTPHWFQAGKGGTVVLSLSTQVTDLDDCFTNPAVVRRTVYGDAGETG